MEQQVDPIVLPPGDRGEFFISDLATRNVSSDALSLLEIALLERAQELGIEIIMTTSERVNGVMVTWRPAV